MYVQELAALQKANRFRAREIFDEDLIDLASNDYLGLAEDKTLFHAAVHEVEKYRYHAPKASQLVNGYHPLHGVFENYLCKINGFEAGIVVGSGFLANLSLIEALPRKKDILILDEQYHASGVLASKLVDADVVYFAHNDATALERILKEHTYQRAIVAVEGVYSMEGDLLSRDIFDVADRYGALLIVDEAHSSGVIGERLLGVFEHYGITPGKNHIKMGTLGKAMGSYGAYILASEEVVTFLQNRAKAIIYATAPSVFDTALAMEAVEKTQREAPLFRAALRDRMVLAETVFGLTLESPIVKLPVQRSHEAMRLKEIMKKEGYLIGAIRPPTVKAPVLRIILRANVPLDKIAYLFEKLKEAGV
ncbi:MAG: pyridoxal phosphate-dependent aminotransferase family protein [Sulfurospirillum sp.]|nr:MAG: pyridoxal phosphate-dependent aminotransferase family protein [Sulfurospirillum sp.]